ncbi:MAG TPA: hypothetical protein VE891_02905 [Allosphingosinicella sp.]|nr:hypothetical protein [Allosphingosinicella sp.]
MDKRIAVTSAELARAIRVWLRVMPRHVWRALEKYQLAALEKRNDPDQEPQVHGAVADHIADHFQKANWEITRPEPKDLGSPPPWRGMAEAGIPKARTDGNSEVAEAREASEAKR